MQLTPTEGRVRPTSATTGRPGRPTAPGSPGSSSPLGQRRPQHRGDERPGAAAQPTGRDRPGGQRRLRGQARLVAGLDDDLLPQGQPSGGPVRRHLRRPAAGGAETLAVADSGISEFQPSISPDGTRICYTLSNNAFNDTAEVVVGNLTTPPNGRNHHLSIARGRLQLHLVPGRLHDRLRERHIRPGHARDGARRQQLSRSRRSSWRRTPAVTTSTATRTGRPMAGPTARTGRSTR